MLDALQKEFRRRKNCSDKSGSGESFLHAGTPYRWAILEAEGALICRILGTNT